MGVGDDDALAAIRVSLGWSTTEADIDRFVEAWRMVFERCGRRVAA
jgi:cysteine desulfurase